MLASWNFWQMVNLWRIQRYGEVNRHMGYPPVEIRTPKELDHEE